MKPKLEEMDKGFTALTQFFHAHDISQRRLQDELQKLWAALERRGDGRLSEPAPRAPTSRPYSDGNLKNHERSTGSGRATPHGSAHELKSATSSQSIDQSFGLMGALRTVSTDAS